jgi:hypothetical protein
MVVIVKAHYIGTKSRLAVGNSIRMAFTVNSHVTIKIDIYKIMVKCVRLDEAAQIARPVVINPFSSSVVKLKPFRAHGDSPVSISVH